MRASFVVLAVVALCARPAHAREHKTATFAVELTGVPWQADALASALRADLADDALRAPPPGKPAELVVRGELRAGELRYAIERAGAAPVRGAIALSGLDRQQLAGVLRDQLHRIVRPADATMPDPPAEVGEPAAIGGAVAALGGFAAVLAIPLAIAGAALRRRALALRGVRRLGAVLVAIAAVAYALVAFGDRLPELSAWVYLAGGLAWGAFAAVVLPVAMPPLVGLHRVEHGELVPVLLAWVALALPRTLAVAVLTAPVAVVLWLLGDALELPPALAFGVVAPLVGLALRLAWRAVAEVLAVRLDGDVVDGDATIAQPWHPQVRAYLVGYLRRANLDVDHGLLDRMRFLPGREPEAVVYGGGLTHTRVVIPRAMLEHALAPYGRPHDYAMPRVSTLHWTHWNAGLVMPTEAGAKLASREDRKPHETVDEGEHERIALGEPPTLSGIIEPRALDPRTSYRPAEDPLWLDWDPGEEYDGTDAGDKDFLFGLLVHAIGVARRREDGAATIALALRRATGRPARLVARAIAPVQRLAAARTATLGDLAVALNGARHHLAQYLAWLLWHRDELATARAYVPELEQTSRRIAATLDAEAGHATRDAAGRRVAALEARLHKLRPFLSGVVAPRSHRRKLALATAALAGIAAVAALVVQAVLYHSTYEERMKAEHERLHDGKGN